MEVRYYLDGKCYFSYDNAVFSSDEDYYNIMELFIDPIHDEVYKKYYQKQLVQQMLEKVLKSNDLIFQRYCGIKSLIENEDISVDYIHEEDETLLKKLMREKLSIEEFAIFEELLFEAGNVAFQEELKFLSEKNSMIEHLWVEYGRNTERKYSY